MDPVNLEESDLKGMEVCNFAGTELALPIDLIEQVNEYYRGVKLSGRVLQLGINAMIVTETINKCLGYYYYCYYYLCDRHLHHYYHHCSFHILTSN